MDDKTERTCCCMSLRGKVHCPGVVRQKQSAGALRCRESALCARKQTTVRLRHNESATWYEERENEGRAPNCCAHRTGCKRKRGCHSLVCGFTCAVEMRKFSLQRLVLLPVSLPAFPGKNWAEVYAWRCRDGSGRCGREWKQRVQRAVSGSFREAKGK